MIGSNLSFLQLNARTTIYMNKMIHRFMYIITNIIINAIERVAVSEGFNAQPSTRPPIAARTLPIILGTLPIQVSAVDKNGCGLT